MRKIPEPVSIVSITIAAELVVVIVVIMFAAITVNGHSIWATIIGWGS